jgi:hypothetical protein
METTLNADRLQARRAVEALRSGVPNRDAVRDLGSRQTKIEECFREKLEVAREGRAAGGLLVAGGFGSGKSHLLEHLRLVAVEDRFVASKVVISKETPLHDPAKVYRAAVEGAVVPDRQGSLLTEIANALDFQSKGYTTFYRWTNSAEAGLNERFPASLYLFENLKAADLEFADRITRFWSGDPIAVGELKRKLREIGEAATWALPPIAQQDLALQRFRFVAHMIQAAGYAGWVLLLDEVELIGRYSPLQRGRSYAELARWVDGGPEPIEGLVAVLAITDDFGPAVLDQKLDLERIPNRLRDRGEALLAERAERGMRIIEGESLSLAGPDQDTLEETYRRLRDIHARAYDWEPPDIDRHVLLLQSRRMREYVRAWITEWDLRRLDPQYRPEIELETLHLGYTEDADLERPPDDPEPQDYGS